MSDDKGFQEIISLALNYSGISRKDHHRFLSAIQDLAGDYPKERRFLSQNLDDKYYAICMKAASAQRNEMDHIILQAEEYLSGEWMVDRTWAHYISEQFAEGVWIFTHPEGAESASGQTDGKRQEHLTTQERQDTEQTIPLMDRNEDLDPSKENGKQNRVENCDPNASKQNKPVILWNLLSALLTVAPFVLIYIIYWNSSCEYLYGAYFLQLLGTLLYLGNSYVSLYFDSRIHRFCYDKNRPGFISPLTRTALMLLLFLPLIMIDRYCIEADSFITLCGIFVIACTFELPAYGLILAAYRVKGTRPRLTIEGHRKKEFIIWLETGIIVLVDALIGTIGLDYMFDHFSLGVICIRSSMEGIAIAVLLAAAMTLNQKFLIKKT